MANLVLEARQEDRFADVASAPPCGGWMHDAGRCLQAWGQHMSFILSGRSARWPGRRRSGWGSATTTRWRVSPSPSPRAWAEARAWVERVLPMAEFPAWVRNRPHGTAGALLYGTVGQGWYSRQDDGSLEFEPEPDGPVWDADLIDGVLRWRKKSS